MTDAGRLTKMYHLLFMDRRNCVAIYADVYSHRYDVAAAGGFFCISCTNLKVRSCKSQTYIENKGCVSVIKCMKKKNKMMISLLR